MARFGIIVFCCFVVLVGGFPNRTQPAEARDAKSCSALAKDALSAAKEACGTATANSLCFGYDAIQAAFAGSAAGSAFKVKGDKVDLSDVTTVTTSAANPDSGQWGVAVLKIQAGLSAPSQGVTAVLYGDASMTSTVRSTPLTTLPAAAKSDTILRGGAGQTYPMAGKLASGQNAVVDGRNKAGDWLRVRLDTTVGWASAAQLKVTGDIQSLTVLEDQDTRADFLYASPMQAFTLTMGNAATCASDAPSGLLLQLIGDKTGDKTAHLSINGADISFSSATLAVRVTAKDRLDVAALTGSAAVSALGNTITINAGEWTRLRVGGKDGVTVIAGSTTKTPYPFAQVDGAPVALLGESVACTVGLPASAKDRVTVRVGPGEERGSLFFMRPDVNYKAIGWAEDAKGGLWWKLDSAQNKEAWVAQSAVRSVGVCDQVEKAEVPDVIVADTSGSDSGDSSGNNAPDAAATAQAAGQGFAPKGPTIWNVTPGQDQLTGTCAPGTPVINYCPSLVQLTPRGTGMQYKGQELKPYQMSRVRENVYAYSGPAPEALGVGTIKLTLVFTSPTTWTITRVLSLKNEPGCQHVYTFTGTFLR